MPVLGSSPVGRTEFASALADIALYEVVSFISPSFREKHAVGL
jgi:hypothetical protein